MTHKIPMKCIHKNICTVGLATLMATALAQPAFADRADRFRPFPSVQYYDVDKELMKRNIAPQGEIRREGTRQASAAAMQRSVFVVDQKLADFIKLAARQNNIRARISPKVKGTIRNLDLPSSLNGMLAILADHFEFDWYQDNDTLYVSTRSENATKVIALGRITYRQLMRILDNIGLKGTGYTLKYIKESNSVLVNGPATLVAKVEVLVASKAENNSGPKLIEYGREQ